MLLSDLDHLETAQLIRRASAESEPTYLFKHTLVQETIHESLLNKDRRRLHILVAQTLEQLYATEREALALVLARHWDEAGETGRALVYYLAAGDHAARVYANAEALEVYERVHQLALTHALTAEQIGHLYASRGRVLELRGEYERALANYQEQEQLGRMSGDSALELDGLVRRATLFVTPNQLFDLSKGWDLCQQALQLARESKNRSAEAKILWNLLLLCNFAGRFDEAIEFGEKSLAIARAENLREQMAFTLNDLARPYAFTSRKQDAFQAQAEADRLWRELDNLPMLADNLSNWGAYSFLFGDYQPSFPRVHEALRISEEIGNEWGQAYANETLGFMYIELCQLDQALKHLQEGAELASRVGFLDAQCTGVSFSGLVYSELGVPETGVPALEQLVANKNFAPEWLVAPYSSLAMLLCDLGNMASAKTALDAAEAAVQSTQDPLAHLSVNLARTHCHLAQDHPELAYGSALDTLEILEKNGLYPFKLLAQYYQGRALVALGRTREALSILQVAEREAKVTGRKSFLWEMQALLATLYRERGEAAQAELLKGKAREAAQYIADHAPAELRADFLNRPQVRRLFDKEPL